MLGHGLTAYGCTRLVNDALAAGAAPADAAHVRGRVDRHDSFRDQNVYSDEEEEDALPARVRHFRRSAGASRGLPPGSVVCNMHE